MIRGLRNGWRLMGIFAILARNDALFVLDPLPAAGVLRALTRPLVRNGEGRPGERLARALREAGPAFIKLGQALSTRSDLLGEDLAADLSELQDRLPPFPGEAARSIIVSEFGRPVEHLFAEFDDTPVAAASIAQVHFAVDTDGRRVAVKVLRPGVEEDFRRHLDLFAWVAERIEAGWPQWRRLRPRESIRILAESVRIEMDLRFEAAAAAELAENFADDPSFRVPGVDWTRTGQRVLTLERVAGIPLDERQAIVAAGHDPHRILAAAAGAFFRQVFRDGFFHADLHPGNLFVQPDGRVVVVDFGIMGRLDATTRRHLAELLLAFLSRDYRRAAEVHFRAGWVPRDRSIAAFAQACRSIAEPILDKPQNEISIARLLGQLFHVTETFGMETQPQLLLLQKTMLVAEGTGRRLAPDANMWWLARPLAEEWMGEAMRPEIRLREAVGDLVETMGRAPEVIHLVEQGAEVLARGQVRLHPDSAHALGGSRSGAIARWLPWLLLAAVLGGWLF